MSLELEPKKDYERILAQALRLDKVARMSLIADLTARLDQEAEPLLGEKHRQSPKMADILAKAQENLSGLNQDQYWAEREQDLAAGLASWGTLEDGSWRG
jgi:hypothetical protein